MFLPSATTRQGRPTLLSEQIIDKGHVATAAEHRRVTAESRLDREVNVPSSIVDTRGRGQGGRLLVIRAMAGQPADSVRLPMFR
jgi:hypothetical protein